MRAVPDRRALLAAVAERDHLIYVMSWDGDAYQRGREDGRREAAESCRETAAHLRRRRDTAVSMLDGRREYALDACANAMDDQAMRFEGKLGALGKPPEPLPPDRLRAENDRLREALARLVDAVSPEPGVRVIAADALRAAREALSR